MPSTIGLQIYCTESSAVPSWIPCMDPYKNRQNCTDQIIDTASAARQDFLSVYSIFTRILGKHLFRWLLDRRQAIIWTNAGMWLIGHLGTCFSEIGSIFIQQNTIYKLVTILSWPQFLSVRIAGGYFSGPRAFKIAVLFQQFFIAICFVSSNNNWDNTGILRLEKKIGVLLAN